MKTSGNTVLITGGATGIGFALAKSLIEAGNSVIVCGRREDKLREAKVILPSLVIRQCDLSKAEERKSLGDWISQEYPDLNILINNAGIQRMIDLKNGPADLMAGDDEIDINLKAVIHLSAYFIPNFMQKKESAIINISSGLGFVPIAAMPVYCATKAAIHSFSQSLRHQLRGTSIKVFEIIPPIVDTDLDKGARDSRGQEDRGIPPSQVAEAVVKALQSDDYELAIGMADNLRKGSMSDPEKTFQNINRW